jgi:hypothetical protein
MTLITYNINNLIQNDQFESSQILVQLNSSYFIATLPNVVSQVCTLHGYYQLMIILIKTLVIKC